MDSTSDLFISYSQVADREMAARLQQGLRRVGAPWFKPSRLKIFRDETGMEAGLPLRASLERRLASCKNFLLLASPAAAASRWVGAEVEWWLAHRTEQPILLVVTAGQIAWDPAANDFDWQRTDCLPPALRGHFTDEPLYIDLRWATDRSSLTLKHERFRYAVLTVAAPLLGLTRDELDVEDRRAQRRFRSLAAVAAVSMIVLATVAYMAWTNARESSAQSAQSRRESESRRLTAEALEQFRSGQQIDRAIALAIYAWRLAHTSEAAATLSTIQRGSSDLARILGQHTESVDGVAFAPDSRVLTTFSRDGSVQFWRVGSWEQIDSGLAGPRGVTESVQFDASGQHVFARSYEANADQLVIWDRATRQQVRVPVDVFPFGLGTMTGAAMSPDATEVAMAQRWRVTVWDTTLQRKRATSPEFGSHVEAIRFSDRDHLILIASAPEPEGVAGSTLDGPPRLYLWDLRSGALSSGPEVKVNSSDGQISHPSFAPDGSFVVWREGYVPVLLERRGLSLRRVAELTGDPAPSGFSGVTGFDAKATRVFVEYQGQIVVWDIAHGRPLKTIGPFSGGDQDAVAAISPDGRWIAGLNQGKVQIWDLDRDRSEAATIEGRCEISSDACLQTLCRKIALPSDSNEWRRLLGQDPRGLDALLLTSSCTAGP